MILVDVANGKQRHVPYRDSKLTFLLQVIIHVTIGTDCLVWLHSVISPVRMPL